MNNYSKVREEIREILGEIYGPIKEGEKHEDDQLDEFYHHFVEELTNEYQDQAKRITDFVIKHSDLSKDWDITLENPYIPYPQVRS